jgi:hypothetical protein
MSTDFDYEMSRSKGMSGTAVRQIILFVILLIVLGALIYEWSVPRRQFNAAVAKMNELREASELADVTPDQVHQALGNREPTNIVEDEPGAYIEQYRWRRAIPGKSFKLDVIYLKGVQGVSLYRSHVPHDYRPEDLPEVQRIKMPEPDERPKIGVGAAGRATTGESKKGKGKSKDADDDKADESGDDKSGAKDDDDMTKEGEPGDKTGEKADDKSGDDGAKSDKADDKSGDDGTKGDQADDKSGDEPADADKGKSDDGKSDDGKSGDDDGSAPKKDDG